MKFRKEHKFFILVMVTFFALAVYIILQGNIVFSLGIFCIFFAVTMGLSYLNYLNATRLEDTQKAIIFSLANLAEWRDPETALHLERTRNYGIILAKELAKNPKYLKVIDADFVDNLYHAAPLHDIGKVGIRDVILHKQDKLTEDEFNEIKHHVVISKNILTEIINKFGYKTKYLPMCLNIAAYHHEKYNGQGYAEALSGADIPLEARIYALCDAYDAIRSKRPYKQSCSHEQAYKIILNESGRHFDPDVVEAFKNCHEAFMEAFETYSMLINKIGIKDSTRNIQKFTIQWDDKLLTGMPKVDAQHKDLIYHINKLIEAILLGEGKEKLSLIFDFLSKYAAEHFAEEEQLMITLQYPDYNFHLSQHLYFIEKLEYFSNTYQQKGIDSQLLLDLSQHIVQWLVKHIADTDKKLGEFFKKSHKDT